MIFCKLLPRVMQMHGIAARRSGQCSEVAVVRVEFRKMLRNGRKAFS